MEKSVVGHRSEVPSSRRPKAITRSSAAGARAAKAAAVGSIHQQLSNMHQELKALAQSREHGEYTVDEFGFDAEWTKAIIPIARILYDRYWRVDLSGTENVPTDGGVLLVSNHAGVFPFDAAMIKVGLLDSAPYRHVHALVADWMFDMPFLSWFIRRAGQTLGHPEDTYRLLSNGNVVLVFPEGIRGTGKPFSERYRLRRFGRGGFVEAAARAEIPIVPVSVVGSEETYPMLGEVPFLNKLLGMPYVPITPTMPWLGPLGFIPLPSKWSIHFHEPIMPHQLISNGTTRTADVMDVTELVRSTIQDGLRQQLMQRRSVFFG